jgi:hypothetical protein
MRIEDLADTDVLSFFLEQRHTYFEMEVIAMGGARYEVLARNSDGSAIGIEFGQLNFFGNFTTTENIPSLGELEGVAIIENGVILEGDFGDVTIHANIIEVKKV